MKEKRKRRTVIRWQCKMLRVCTGRCITMGEFAAAAAAAATSPPLPLPHSRRPLLLLDEDEDEMRMGNCFPDLLIDDDDHDYTNDKI